MSSSERPKADISHLLKAVAEDPLKRLSATIALAESSQARIALAKLRGESDEAAMMAGRAFPALLIQALELEHSDDGDGAPKDDGPWGRLAAKIAYAQGERRDRYELATVLLDGRGEDGDVVVLRSAALAGDEGYELSALPRSAKSALLVELAKQSLAEKGVDAAAIAHPLAPSDLLRLPYDGTEFAIVMKMAKDDVRPILTRGEWLESEGIHGELSWSLSECFSDEPPGLYLLTGQGWRVAHIPYECDADAGFDADVRPYAPADAAIFGSTHGDAIEEAKGQLEADEPVPEFLQ